MIETLGGPVIACLLFLMPMYAIRQVPACVSTRANRRMCSSC
jgi:amino acid permease